MAFGIYMQNKLTPDQYDKAINKLAQVGAGAPKGRTYHSAFLEDGTISVFDVWDSMEEFEAFGAIMIPIVEEVGGQVVEPAISEIHNVIAA